MTEGDIVREQGQNIPTDMRTRYLEMPDGTHALVLAFVGVSSDDEPFFTSVDEITGAQVTIPVVHHEVHEGEMFQVSYFAASIANNATIAIHLLTGAKYGHLVFEAACGGDAEVEFITAPTINANGTALTESNMKLYSDETATVQAFHTPTFVGGTVRAGVLAPGGTGGIAAGGGARANTEWILTPNTSYIVQLTNISGSAKAASVLAQWYEESDP